jgi:hypothetical protein
MKLFSMDSHLREIYKVRECTSHCRIDIPSSVKIIVSNGFFGCTSLNEFFSSDNHLRWIDKFGESTSICRIEIRSSVEVIGNDGFSDSPSLRVVIIRSGCRLRRNEGFQNAHPFLVYEYEYVKQSRRHVHLGIRRTKVLDGGW